ncbi:MAG: hypothetical protein F4210_09785 [Holophagales bacterium]|nr:hypothetical protein [Holophagales bacterium]MYF95780.1 hypothetical protein [Holophagales bacterium]
MPAVGVMTSAFVDGAELMAHACGAPDYRFAVIEHPISSATDIELLERAGEIVRQAEELVLAGGPQNPP